MIRVEATYGTISDVLSSQLCTLKSLTSPTLRSWGQRLRPVWDPEGINPLEMLVHRKMWEWLYICEALAERGMLQSGRAGIGFGVGKEPLVAVFAAEGCRILASDLPRILQRLRAGGNRGSNTPTDWRD